MTLEEYDEYIHGRSDFIKATKKDSSNERKVSVTSVLSVVARSAYCGMPTMMNYQEHFQWKCIEKTYAMKSKSLLVL